MEMLNLFKRMLSTNKILLLRIWFLIQGIGTILFVVWSYNNWNISNFIKYPTYIILYLFLPTFQDSFISNERFKETYFSSKDKRL